MANTIPANWHDDGTTLTAPNGHRVVHGFRYYILTHPWQADDLPEEEEKTVDSVDSTRPALGAGSRQTFTRSILIWTAALDVQRLDVLPAPTPTPVPTPAPTLTLAQLTALIQAAFAPVGDTLQQIQTEVNTAITTVNTAISTSATALLAALQTVPTPVPDPVPDPTPGGTPVPVGVSGYSKLLFADEFDGTGLDTTKWGMCYFNGLLNGGQYCQHGELNIYMPSQVTVANSLLQLRAEHIPLTASDGHTYAYRSGMINSGPNEKTGTGFFAYTYGYAEMRAKVPAGRGLWPAFWLLPQDKTWPPEIDIFEFLGEDPNQDHMTNHDEGGGQSGSTYTGPDFSADYHVYGLDWQPGLLVWYVDGVERKRITGGVVTARPMTILANLAVGGPWPLPPDSSTPFPADFLIDYIRVWQA